MERARFLTSDFVKVMNAGMLGRYAFSDEHVYPIVDWGQAGPVFAPYDKNKDLYHHCRRARIRPAWRGHDARFACKKTV